MLFLTNEHDLAIFTMAALSVVWVVVELGRKKELLEALLNH